jgi:Bacterial PH domain
MIAEHDDEPVRGLPGALPPGERILWQGSPDFRALAVHAFHIRAVAIYFALLVAWNGVQAARGVGTWAGTGMTLGVGVLGVGIVALLAWGSARTTIYTLTNKRVVLRFGMALPKCVNLPLVQLTSADLRMLDRDHGDIALTIGAEQRLGWLQLWPHAKPWAVNEVKPMLRGISEADKLAGLLGRTAAAVQGVELDTAPRLAVAA